MLLPYIFRQILYQKLWQMLLPIKYVNLWQMESHCGRCCDHLIGWLADVNAKVADGKANFQGWLMLLPLWQLEWPHRMEWFSINHLGQLFIVFYFICFLFILILFSYCLFNY